MNRYADAVRATHVPTGSRLPDGGRSAALAGQVMNLLAGAVGSKLAALRPAQRHSECGSGRASWKAA